MPSISEQRSFDGQAFRLSTRGLQAEVEMGVAAGSRGGPVGDDMSDQIRANAGLELLGETTVSALELTGPGGRGGGADGEIVVTPSGLVGVNTVVQVEEDGRYVWFFPDASGQISVPVEAGTTTRGLFGDALRRVVRVIVVKMGREITALATRTLVGAWDNRRHETHVRTWTPDDYRSKDAPTADVAALAGGRSLLVVHGFAGSIHSSFSFERDVVSDIHRSYGGRTFAFDHPTLAVAPDKNARDLLALLPPDARLEVDILAHSRGGLVARELARLRDPRLTVRSILFVGTPNDGTPLADVERPQGLLDALTTLVSAVPGSEPVEMALELVQDIVLKSALPALDGLVAMHTGGKYLASLNEARPEPLLTLRAIAADYEPRTDSAIVRTARNRLIDLYFGGVRNDLIVPTVSAYLSEGGFQIPASERLVLDSSRSIDHSSFWADERFVHQVRNWLRPDTDVNPPAPLQGDETDPKAETAQLPDPRYLSDLADSIKKLPADARKAIEQFVGGPISPNAQSTTGLRRAVVVVPGIMGSHLRRASDNAALWIDPRRLMRGGFAELKMDGTGANGIEPAGLHRSYLPLVMRLSESSDVYYADYDWRDDIEKSARRLSDVIERAIDKRPERPVHLVAHSMGGLVARALMLVNADLWNEIGSAARVQAGESSGRLVMLGTPQQGSFSTPLTLTGDERIVKGLCAFDLRSDAKEILAVIRSFPALYQMLPAEQAAPGDDQHRDLFTATHWGQEAPIVDQDLLEYAREFQTRLADANEPDRMTCVAGYGHITPFRLQVVRPGKFSIGQTRRGDGRVATALASLDPERTYFCDATHGGLIADARVLAALDDLLAGRVPEGLKDEEPVFREVNGEQVRMISAEEWDPSPVISRTRGGSSTGKYGDADAMFEDALTLTLGGVAASASQPHLRVRVVNASLEHSRYPVAVGHYSGLPQGGAEQFLDQKLGGTLKRRLRLGLYPQDEGTAAYIPAPRGTWPRGAVVLGLGNFGALTRASLSAAMTQGVLDVLLHESEQQTVRPGGLGISAVVVGAPGRWGPPLESAVTALAEGVAHALLKMKECEGETTRVGPTEFELEFVEIYEQRAERIAEIVEKLSALLEPRIVGNVDLRVDDQLERKAGARPGWPPAVELSEPWVRVEVELPERPQRDALPRIDTTETTDDPHAWPGALGIRSLTLTTLARGAQANQIEYDVDFDKVRHFVDSVIHEDAAREIHRRSNDADSGVSRTLYELLFPHRAKLDLDPSENLHLLLDERIAQIPWELLSARGGQGDSRALALRAGMLRQLHSRELTRERWERPIGFEALVIGDPPTGYPRLPGARREARAVEELLRANRWEVESRIYDASEQPGDEWADMLTLLHSRPYRAIHIAAHGVFDEQQSERSGVVIGPAPHHRLSALDFRQMMVTPDLVFLNCCHLGRLGSFLQGARSGDAPAGDGTSLVQPHRVAATVARQLLLNGVSAVIVAGWAVDDSAAATFSDRLYRCLLDGQSLGLAVRAARNAAHAADGGRSNTWGAYQCWGDPDFRLVPDEGARSVKFQSVSARQFAHELEILEIRAGDAASAEHRRKLTEDLVARCEAGKRYLQEPEVMAALARAYGQLGEYGEAIGAYNSAFAHEKACASIIDVQQYANYCARHAVKVARGAASSEYTSDQLFERAANLLGGARGLASVTGPGGEDTAERHALWGSLHKKRATVQRDQRLEQICASRDAYARAWHVSSAGRPKQSPYHTNLWLQMTALADEENALPQTSREHLEALLEQIWSPSQAPEDYWDAAGFADTLVTCAAVGYDYEKENTQVVTQGLAEFLSRRELNGSPRAWLDEALTNYRMAFGLHASHVNKLSSIEHIGDLVCIVEDDPRRGDLHTALGDTHEALEEELSM